MLDNRTYESTNLSCLLEAESLARAFSALSTLTGGISMNSIRKLFCAVTVVLLAAFAQPSLGAATLKLYNLATISSTPLTVVLQLDNVSPEGNSQISSFRASVKNATIIGVVQPASGTATFTATSVSVSNMYPLKPDGGIFELTVNLASCGDNIEWQSEGTFNGVLNGVWTGSSWTGQQFSPVSLSLVSNVSCATVDCGDSFTAANSDLSSSISGKRGNKDKDGATVNFGCEPVQLYVSNGLATNHQVHVRWPLGSGPGNDPMAALTYTIFSSSLTPPAARVAWLNTAGGSAETGTPAYVAAQTCNPFPTVFPPPDGTPDILATLTETLLGTNTKATVNPSGIPFPATPFAATIGTERVRVDNVSGNNTKLTLVRGQGGTTAQDYIVGGATIWYFVSNPLPLLPASITCYDGNGAVLPAASCPYTPFFQAQMCIADQGPYPTSGTPTGSFIRYIDIADGWIYQP